MAKWAFCGGVGRVRGGEEVWVDMADILVERELVRCCYV